MMSTPLDGFDELAGKPQRVTSRTNSSLTRDGTVPTVEIGWRALPAGSISQTRVDADPAEKRQLWHHRRLLTSS
jgi:hypothetical protein